MNAAAVLDEVEWEEVCPVVEDGDMARFEPEREEVDGFTFVDMGVAPAPPLSAPPPPAPPAPPLSTVVKAAAPPPSAVVKAAPLAAPPSSIETNMGFSLSNSLLNILKSFHC